MSSRRSGLAAFFLLGGVLAVDACGGGDQFSSATGGTGVGASAGTNASQGGSGVGASGGSATNGGTNAEGGTNTNGGSGGSHAGHAGKGGAGEGGSKGGAGSGNGGSGQSGVGASGGAMQMGVGGGAGDGSVGGTSAVGGTSSAGGDSSMSGTTSAGGDGSIGGAGATAGPGGSPDAGGGPATGGFGGDVSTAGNGGVGGDASPVGTGGFGGDVSTAGAGGTSTGNACNFDVCDANSGAPALDQCTDCKAAVCAKELGCCEDSWDASCAVLARQTAACGCHALYCNPNGPAGGKDPTCAAQMTCNPIAETGCGATASHCELHVSDGGQEITQCALTGEGAACSACDEPAGMGCLSGFSCVEGFCVQPCCEDADCAAAGSAKCDLTMLGSGQPIGVCVTP